MEEKHLAANSIRTEVLIVKVILSKYLSLIDISEKSLYDSVSYKLLEIA
jgi:hypothetical protein